MVQVILSLKTTCQFFKIQMIFPLLFIGAFCVRFLFIVLGSWIDQASKFSQTDLFLDFSLHYTDIDYHVFSDAARLVIAGKSPFLRETYRYTPFLYDILFLFPMALMDRAFLLIPNHLIGNAFGKVLFSILDLFCGYVIDCILQLESVSEAQRRTCTVLWLFNPFILFISTRGSADSIVCFLVLATILCLKRKQFFLAGFIFGFSIHFKLFPIIYSLAFFLYCWKTGHSSNPLACVRTSFQFTATSILSFLVCTGIAWYLYGNQYLSEALFYHAIRIDCRHNYSLLFYPSYLGDSSVVSISFILQAWLIFLVSCYYSRTLEIAVTLISFLFVAYNRVVTAQYFVWWLAPLITAIPYFAISTRKWILLFLLYFGAQNGWNSVAYALEFDGKSTFVEIWIACIFFFLSSVYFINCLIETSRGKEKAD